MSDADAPDATTDYRTNHWAGVSAVALVMGGLGVLAREPSLVLSGVIGAAFAGYAGVARPPRVRAEDDAPVLDVGRTLSDSSPEPGDEVTVTVHVRNVGDAFLPDVRFVDDVPSGLEVVDGSPRHATALRPGAGVEFSYTVAATRGEHDWRRVTVIAADASGSVERETAVDAETTLDATVAVVSAGDLPLRALTTRLVGRVDTDSGGAGVEFFATREYQPSDPLNRIDWYRQARTGDLGTLEFRRERAATVVLLVDARSVAYRAPDPGARHAVERSVSAASGVVSALLDAGDRAGVAVFGPEEAWLAPATGDEHRARVRHLLTTHPSLSTVPPEGRLYASFRADRREELRRRRIRRLHARLPDDAQVIVLSPCCDDYLPRVARRLDAYGHLVTVVSPDPTADDAPGRRLVRMEREDRLRALRRDGLRVIDWPRDESLAAALTRAQARWST